MNTNKLISPEDLPVIEQKYSREFGNSALIKKIISAAGKDNRTFDELIFTGKYLSGLISAAGKQQFTNDNIIKKEILEGLEKIKNGMRFLLDSNSEFEEVLRNDLQNFLSDLELLKLYANDLKQRS